MVENVLVLCTIEWNSSQDSIVMVENVRVLGFSSQEPSQIYNNL